MFGNAFLTGLTLGAGAMYYFDARQGTGRRKKLADQFNRLTNRACRDLDASWRDLSNRARGTVAQAQGLFRSDHASDEVICNRVRSVMGHVVSNPSSIEVNANLGHVVLRGPVPRSELPRLLSNVGLVRGVRTVTDELVVQDEGPESQAPSRRQQMPLLQRSVQSEWAPGTKLLMGTLGATLLANCMMSRRRSLTDVTLGTLGFGMLVKAVGTRNVGYRQGRQVEFHKTLEINAPVEKVFNFFLHEENLPAISDKVQEVRAEGNDRFVKSVALPGGITVHLAERFHCVQPEECICSRSEPDSLLQYEKKMNFEADENRTRVHLQFSYSPPGGVMGYAAAATLGMDAKSFFDDLMMRAKTFLETGIQPHDAAKRMFAQGQQPQSQGEQSFSKSATETTAPSATAPAGSAFQTTKEFGANVPPHEAPPEIGGVAETDPLAQAEHDLTTPTEAEQAAMRNHI
jgi:uncharacterized membrane protein